MRSATYWEIGADRRAEWLSLGLPSRYFFAHRIYRLPKCGPDGFKLGLWMRGTAEVTHHWQLVMYAHPDALAGLADELFSDDELMWHRQQFGRPGQIATVSLVLEGKDLYALAPHADFVQRIGRRREHKTRVENRFKGWPRMLLNGILAFAADHGARRVHIPTSRLAMRHTDPARHVGAPLFERVYDRSVRPYQPKERDGWWVIKVRGRRRSILAPELGHEALPAERTVCLCHDLERGLGHVGIDEPLRARATAEAAQTLATMLKLEADAGVRVTYNVVGQILPEVQASIEAGGHCVAFHSYDHAVSDDHTGDEQLWRCREVDYRIKGYRPPQSRLTPELSDYNLAFHNFEWLASSSSSLGHELPRMERRIVRLPIARDDWDLYRGVISYDDWQREVLAQVRASPYSAVSLHDCYAPWWLERYRELLELLGREARLCTMDEVAAEVALGCAV